MIVSPMRRGLSIVEMLMGLAIVSMLLAAVAAAFSASSNVIETNDQFFRATQASRVAMNQLLTEVRRAHAISSGYNKIDMITFDGVDQSYVYDPTRKTLKLVLNGATPQAYSLAENVTTCAFTTDSRTDKGGISHVVRVAITLDVSVGSNHMRLTGSAALRRERSYE